MPEVVVNKIISFMSTKYNVRVRVANGNGNIPIHVNILKKIYSYSKIMVMYDLDGNNNLDMISNLAFVHPDAKIGENVENGKIITDISSMMIEYNLIHQK